MQAFDFISAQLATVAYQDGFDDGLPGMLAVAFSLRNRIRAGFWNGDWIALLNNHFSYSAYLTPPHSEIPDPRVYSVQCLLQEIDGIYRGTRRDDVTVPKDSIFDQFKIGDKPPVALYYARLDKITNPWFIENITRQPATHPRIAQVGMTVFFG